MSPSIPLKILANTGFLWAAMRYIPGFHIAPMEFFQFEALPVDPLIQTLVAGGIALAIANTLLYPVMSIIAALLPLITTPMLMVVLNMALLYTVMLLSPVLSISGLEPLFWSGLFLGVINSLL